MAKWGEDFDTWEPTQDYPSAPPARSAQLGQTPLRARLGSPGSPTSAQGRAASFFQEFSLASESAKTAGEEHKALPYADSPGIAALIANAQNMLNSDGPDAPDSFGDGFVAHTARNGGAKAAGAGGFPRADANGMPGGGAGAPPPAGASVRGSGDSFPGGRGLRSDRMSPVSPASGTLRGDRGRERVPAGAGETPGGSAGVAGHANPGFGFDSGNGLAHGVSLDGARMGSRSGTVRDDSGYPVPASPVPAHSEGWKKLVDGWQDFPAKRREAGADSREVPAPFSSPVPSPLPSSAPLPAPSPTRPLPHSRKGAGATGTAAGGTPGDYGRENGSASEAPARAPRVSPADTGLADSWDADLARSGELPTVLSTGGYFGNDSAGFANAGYRGTGGNSLGDSGSGYRDTGSNGNSSRFEPLGASVSFPAPGEASIFGQPASLTGEKPDPKGSLVAPSFAFPASNRRGGASPLPPTPAVSSSDSSSTPSPPPGRGKNLPVWRSISAPTPEGPTRLRFRRVDPDYPAFPDEPPDSGNSMSRAAVFIAAVLLSLICVGIGVGVGLSMRPSPAPLPTVTVSSPAAQPGQTPDSVSNRPDLQSRDSQGQPDVLRGLKVALDPGHNGGNAAAWAKIGQNVSDGRGGQRACNTTGTATDDGFSEHEFNWRMANLVKARLESAGASVFLTRDSDVGVGPCVNERGTFAQKVGADVLVSIHANGSADSSVHGFFALVSDPPLYPSQGEPSQSLARDLIGALREVGFVPQNAGPVSHGLWKRSDLATLNFAEVPAVMLELGEMRNPADAALLHSSSGQERLAEGIIKGLRTWASSRVDSTVHPGGGGAGTAGQDHSPMPGSSPDAASSPAGSASSAGSGSSGGRGDLGGRGNSAGSGASGSPVPPGGSSSSPLPSP